MLVFNKLFIFKDAVKFINYFDRNKEKFPGLTFPKKKKINKESTHREPTKFPVSKRFLLTINYNIIYNLKNI